MDSRSTQIKTESGRCIKCVEVYRANLPQCFNVSRPIRCSSPIVPRSVLVPQMSISSSAYFSYSSLDTLRLICPGAPKYAPRSIYFSVPIVLKPVCSSSPNVPKPYLPHIAYIVPLPICSRDPNVPKSICPNCSLPQLFHCTFALNVPGKLLHHTNYLNVPRPICPSSSNAARPICFSTHLLRCLLLLVPQMFPSPFVPCGPEDSKAH